MQQIFLNKLIRRASHSDANVLSVMQRKIAAGAQDAFYIVNTSAVEQKFHQWTTQLPRVHPFYAVKCNPDEKILSLLAELGCNFDCASQNEIEAVLHTGAKSDRILYANPCKQISHIQFAKSKRVNTMTFDSCDELDKIAAVYPSANVLLRILVDDSTAQCPLGNKFGATLNEVREVLRHALTLDLTVTGISFHVGSGCTDARAYSDAVLLARKAFDIAHDLGFSTLSVLDIGGGFPGEEDPTKISFSDIAVELNTALDRYFPSEQSIEIIAEPGRFFAAASHTLATNIIGRKVLKPHALSSMTNPSPCLPQVRHLHSTHPLPTFMYYVNDGLYGSFNCLMYDHATVSAQAVQPPTSTTEYPSSVWGPTCDGLDCILKEVRLPVLQIGQWLYFRNMGAYTSAASSNFNGFEIPEKIYI